jgi:hypothetical protein
LKTFGVAPVLHKHAHRGIVGRRGGRCWTGGVRKAAAWMRVGISSRSSERRTLWWWWWWHAGRVVAGLRRGGRCKPGCR